MSLSVSYVLAPGDSYQQSTPFWGADGVHTSVLYNTRDHRSYAAIQGGPAQLRELAAALTAAAAAAEQWATANPATEQVD
jgi:hypothetical protein